MVKRRRESLIEAKKIKIAINALHPIALDFYPSKCFAFAFYLYYCFFVYFFPVYFYKNILVKERELEDERKEKKRRERGRGRIGKYGKGKRVRKGRKFR